ncbi:hypothetical protein [Veillonella intestinalis]|uniref:hypothetical protein n=1 Tax=Veillonella intestinalis TaxID=2941341 RepID=UPI00203DC8F0|nr:hypothetical protein [Veillonella intestinalis]
MKKRCLLLGIMMFFTIVPSYASDGITANALIGKWIAIKDSTTMTITSNAINKAPYYLRDIEREGELTKISIIINGKNILTFIFANNNPNLFKLIRSDSTEGEYYSR